MIVNLLCAAVVAAVVYGMGWWVEEYLMAVAFSSVDKRQRRAPEEAA